MMTGAQIGDVCAVLFVAATIYVLVRPRSKAGDLLDAITAATVAVVSAATDLGR